MNSFFKRFQQDVRSIGFLGLGLFIALALMSYNPKDPSFNSTGQGLNTLNYCGILGSFLADLLYQAFGVTIWIGVAGLFHAAVESFRGEKIQFKDARHLLALALIAFTAALVTIYFPNTRMFNGQIYPGGLVGLGISMGFVKLLNTVGAQIVLWTMSLVLFVFYFEFSIQKAAERPLDRMIIWWNKLDKTSFMAGWQWPSLKDLKKEKAKESAKEKKADTKAKQPESSVAENLITQPKVKEKFIEDEDDEDDIDAESVNGMNAADADEDDEASIFDDEEESDTAEVQVSAYEPPARRKVIAPVKTPRRVENWSMPKLSLLDDPPVSRIKIDEKEIRRKADITLAKLKTFGVDGQIVAAKPGPVVTMFEFKPNMDVRVSDVSKLADDLSLALSAESLRIIAPIPGRDVVGIETSNAQRETVYLKDLLGDEKFWSEDIKLPIALGKQTNGDPRIVDLRKMPHLLIAGTTGSGKSVFTVSTLIGFLFRHSPKTLRLILVDPKQVDLAAFSDIPHLIMPPIREAKKAVFALRWAVKEMDKRYKSMSKFKTRNLEEFNAKMESLTADQVAEHEKVNAEYEAQGGLLKLEQYYYTPQPYIVIAVEEFGDLMAVDKQNVEQSVVRLAQMARACGMHLMLAMQSPRKDVVTGLIKTNIPARISFRVASKMDSRIILDEGGAERLLSQGDMLYSAGADKSTRHHGPFLKENEINTVAKFWADQGEPEFDALAMRALEGGPSQSSFAGMNGEGAEFAGADADEEYDEKYDEILSWAATQKAISASLIQRRFKLGYPRAARMIEVFEREGVVGPANGSKPRAVLVASHQG
ncbi:cell division protein FtsK [Bdellovibrio sp. qaytius]|nr:cell division protein FtsK [Bdellovibrio sp. qaytius]